MAWFSRGQSRAAKRRAFLNGTDTESSRKARQLLTVAVIERLEERVVLSSTTTVLTDAPNPSSFGAPVTLTATVTGTGTPDGTVTFLNGSTNLGTATLDASGIGTFVTTAQQLAVGSHSLTAAYGGSGATFDPSTSTPVSQVVDADTTTTTLISGTNPSSFGQAVTFTATVAGGNTGAGTPTGTVTFLDGTTTLGTGTLDGTGKATFTTTAPGLSVGSHSITAVYGATTRFATSTSTAVNQTVSAASTTTALAVSPASPSFGVPVVLTATVTPSNAGAGVPTGTVTFLNGTTTLGTGTLDGTGKATFTTTAQQLTVATHSITASYAATTKFAASTSTASSVVVAAAPTVTTLSSSNASSLFGAPLTITATVAPVNAAAGIPTGSVTFLDGTTTLGTGTLSASGVATFSSSTLAVASHNITATYGGVTNYAASTSSALTQVIEETPTTIHLGTSAGGLNVGDTLTLTAKVTPSITETTLPTGTVSFLDGTKVIGTGTLANGVATFKVSNLAIGFHTLTVSYPGDTNYLAATGANTPQVAIGTANQLYVFALYKDLYNRAPDDKGMTYWTGLLDQGVSRTRVAVKFQMTREFALSTLDSLSQTLLGEAPTQAQINHVLKLQSKGQAGPGAIEYYLLGSPAYYKASGGTNSGFVTDLGIFVTASGFTAGQEANLVSDLASGASQSSVALAGLRSSDALINRVDQDYTLYLDRSSDLLGQSYFVNQLRRKATGVTVAAEILGSEEYFADNTIAPAATA